jgi:hypothetical protein
MHITFTMKLMETPVAMGETPAVETFVIRLACAHFGSLKEMQEHARLILCGMVFNAGHHREDVIFSIKMD